MTRYVANVLPSLLLMLLTLAGCTALPPKQEDMGTTISAFTHKYGPPTDVTETSSGKRLVYRTGPYGEETYFVDVEPTGRITAWQQVLTEDNFKKIQPNMPAQAVIDLLGPCSETRSLARNRGSVCSYRYRSPFCQWFSIELTAEGLVRSAGYLPDPRCDDSRFGLFRFQF
jgi:hypothetical protein